MNFDFAYYMPTRILFGAGKLKELASMTFLPGRKALLVTGAAGAMKKHGYRDRVKDYLSKNSVETVEFDKIIANPIVEHVEQGAAAARQNRCDFVLGLGGGSTIDSAKSIAVMATNPGTYWDYISGGTGGGKIPPNKPLPIVAVPTTAGTGTESDPWTVITNPDTREKIGWGVPETFPVLSIVDPELMLSVPPDVTAHTGIDAFCHAAEGYLATVSQPASDSHALEAISLITRYLPIAVKDGSNLEARTCLAWAACEAGMCESLSCCISHHSMEHALSAFYPDMPHGAGLGMLAVAYFSYIAERKPDRFPAMARAMGAEVDRLSDAEAAAAFIAALENLLAAAGLSSEKLSAYGVKREDLPELADNSLNAMGFLYELTPVTLSRDDVIAIYERAFA